jgi:uncharacterized membrane protein
MQRSGHPPFPDSPHTSFFNLHLRLFSNLLLRLVLQLNLHFLPSILFFLYFPSILSICFCLLISSFVFLFLLIFLLCL